MDRMTGILLLLQDRSRDCPCRAAELADHFEVSRRTILRDVQSLCEMGVPVIAQDGPGGGFSLPKDYALTPLPLTVHESILMLFALSGLDRLSDAPFATARETLKAKLRSLIPARHESDVGRTLETISFGGPIRDSRAPYLETLLAAAQSGSWLEVVYRSAARESTQLLQPLRLSTSGGLWYCRALSSEHGDERTYRVDRVLSARPAEPPESFVRNRSIDYHDESHPEVVIRLTAAGVERAEQEQNIGPAIVREEDGSGVLRLRCPPSELRWFSEYVVSLGAHAEAIAPEPLRNRVRELASAIAQRHSKNTSD
jgi:predicted DNA-binding transcriptional regulator YafY